MVHLVHGGTTRVFVGRQFGRGMASYERAPGYQASSVPTKVGARYFFPDPEYDETTDQPIPAAVGHKWEPGGKLGYQMKVFQAAEKFGKAQGLSKADIKNLEPRQVA